MPYLVFFTVWHKADTVQVNGGFVCRMTKGSDIQKAVILPDKEQHFHADRCSQCLLLQLFCVKNSIIACRL